MKKGDKVRLIHNLAHELNKGYLMVGHIYTVERLGNEGWDGTVYLKGYPNLGVHYMCLQLVEGSGPCQCGGDKINSPMHSTWCPKREENT